ncbi:hypothetical protein F5Y14DRAFT_435195 [Nemania sp. NC0429]|nr:hypothetical protein F5Y14DRAFT_435195 [Nemania sp. NC0429]
MIGCLGGLGRSFRRWMMTRGARSLVFLGRSDCINLVARALVDRLRNSGAQFTVVEGAGRTQ